MTAYRPVMDGTPTGRYAVVGCKLKQNANEGCNSCASLAGLVLSFIACFTLLVTAPLGLHDVYRSTTERSGINFVDIKLLTS